MKHMWEIIAIGGINKETVREVIRLTTVNKNVEIVTYLHRYEEVYIMLISKMYGVRVLSKYTTILPMDLQEVLHNLGKMNNINKISSKSTIKYSPNLNLVPGKLTTVLTVIFYLLPFLIATNIYVWLCIHTVAFV